MLAALTKQGLTKPQKQILGEFLVQYYSFVCEIMLRHTEERGLSFVPLGFKTAAEFWKWKHDYDKAYYGKCWNSEKGRRAVHFLRAKHNAAIWENGHGRQRGNGLRSLAPLLGGLDKLDEESLKALLEATKILESYSGNSLPKRVLGSRLVSGPAQLSQTWKEIRQKHFPDYVGSSQNFQKYLRTAGIHLKPVGKWRGPKCVRKRRKNTH